MSSRDRHTKSVSTCTVRQPPGTEDISKRRCEAFLNGTGGQLTSDNNENTSYIQDICDIKSKSVSMGDDVKEITSDINDNEKRSETLFSSNDCSKPSGSNVYYEDSGVNNADCDTHVNATGMPPSRNPNDFAPGTQQKVSSKDADKNVNQGFECTSPQPDSLAKQVTITRCFPKFSFHLPVNKTVVGSDLSDRVSYITHPEKVRNSDSANQENQQLDCTAFTRNVTVNEGDDKSGDSSKCERHEENVDYHKNNVASNVFSGSLIGGPRKSVAAKIDIDRFSRVPVSQEFDAKAKTTERKWKKQHNDMITQK